ncbi:AIR synthase-related protein, partial [Enterococcus faecalis]
SGLHSNGYSLVRNVFFKKHSFKTTDELPELAPKTLGEELLTPTKIYVKELLPLLKAGLVHGAAHITGGGFLENLPRMFSSSLAAEIQLNSWPVLPIFKLIQKYGEIPSEEMYEIFNMGLGMILAVSPE